MREFGGYNVFSSDRKPFNISSREETVYWLNLGRNALRLLLESVSPKKIFVPSYSCETVHKVVEEIVQDVVYYHIDLDFLPVLGEEVSSSDYFIVNDYYGICQRKIDYFFENFNGNLIIDSSQSFFSQYNIKHSKFTSPRKFFGLTDGGILETNSDCSKIFNQLEIDKSSKRIEHIFACDETSKNEEYQSYLSYRRSIQNLPLMKVSVSTQVLFNTIDIEYCRKRRLENFKIIHECINDKNEIKLDFDIAPMFYPFLIPTGNSLKKKLINSKIYLPSYWPKSPYINEFSPFEEHLRLNLCCIPIDQGISKEEMHYIVKKTLSYLS